MSASVQPPFFSSAATKAAIFGICPRSATVGISIAVLNIAFDRACHAGSSFDGPSDRIGGESRRSTGSKQAGGGETGAWIFPPKD